MLSVSILNMYAEGFESLVKLPKFSLKKKIKADKKQEPETSNVEPNIKYFAEPNNVSASDAKDSLFIS